MTYIITLLVVLLVAVLYYFSQKKEKKEKPELKELVLPKSSIARLVPGELSFKNYVLEDNQTNVQIKKLDEFNLINPEKTKNSLPNWLYSFSCYGFNKDILSMPKINYPSHDMRLSLVHIANPEKPLVRRGHSVFSKEEAETIAYIMALYKLKRVELFTTFNDKPSILHKVTNAKELVIFLNLITGANKSLRTYQLLYQKNHKKILGSE